MPIDYKIEILFQTEMSEFLWCIIKIDDACSYNIGHGTATTFLEAAQKAYIFFLTAIE